MFSGAFTSSSNCNARRRASLPRSISSSARRCVLADSERRRRIAQASCGCVAQSRKHRVRAVSGPPRAGCITLVACFWHQSHLRNAMRAKLQQGANYPPNGTCTFTHYSYPAKVSSPARFSGEVCRCRHPSAKRIDAELRDASCEVSRSLNLRPGTLAVQQKN